MTMTTTTTMTTSATMMESMTMTELPERIWACMGGPMVGLFVSGGNNGGWPEYVRADAIEALTAERDRLREAKDQAYLERNHLVALLAGMFPSGLKRTDIPGWDAEWHGAVYIDFPWGQASWHYHDSQAHLFAHLPPYPGEWDGHTTDHKYAAILAALKGETP